MSEAFVVPDLLTLLAVSGDYPFGFVGVGTRPNRFYCLQSLLTNGLAFKSVNEQVKRARNGEDIILLFPHYVDVEAMFNDCVIGNCQGCGHRIDEH